MNRRRNVLAAVLIKYTTVKGGMYVVIAQFRCKFFPPGLGKDRSIAPVILLPIKHQDAKRGQLWGKELFSNQGAARYK